MWIDPTTLVARAAAVTSSLTLHRQATAAALASSFSLTRVWTSNQPTTRDLPFNTTSTVQWLLDYWSLERKVSTTDIEFVEDPFSGSVAVGDPLVLKVDYPAGEKGGVQFWPLPFLNTTNVSMAVLTYDVAFNDTFDFVKGGKLPGLFGGEDTGECTGGDKRFTCFSARLMWRPEGAGEVYQYAPTYPELCEQTDVHCGTVYGTSLSRGAWTFSKGGWTTVTQFVGLNTPPLANGLLYIYVNDTLVLAHTGLVWRTDDSIYLSRILFSTFFGGSTASYNPKTNQSAYFRNFEVWQGVNASNTTGPAVNATLYSDPNASDDGTSGGSTIVGGATLRWVGTLLMLGVGVLVL